MVKAVTLRRHFVPRWCNHTLADDDDKVGEVAVGGVHQADQALKRRGLRRVLLTVDQNEFVRTRPPTLLSRLLSAECRQRKSAQNNADVDSRTWSQGLDSNQRYTVLQTGPLPTSSAVEAPTRSKSVGRFHY
jgi:hypothetical protein